MRALLFGCSLALLAPAVALAQQADPATPAPPSAKPEKQDSIIVTGRPAYDRKAVEALVAAITSPAGQQDPLARFNDSVCFVTFGLDRPTLEQIGDRLAADAEQAGLHLAGPRCHPNVAILFLDGVAATLEQLQRRHAALFGDRTPGELREIARQPGPVRAWSNVRVYQRAVGSHLVSDASYHILSSMVLIERSAVVGKTINQIGDYAAMRALAEIRLRRPIGGGSILSLFDAGSTPPMEMSAFDRGYLRGLYSGGSDQLAYVHRGRIAQRILKMQSSDATKPAN